MGAFVAIYISFWIQDYFSWNPAEIKNNCSISAMGRNGGTRIYLAYGAIYAIKDNPEKNYSIVTIHTLHVPPEQFAKIQCFDTREEAEAAGYKREWEIAIRDKTMEIVMDYEKRSGRNPKRNPRLDYAGDVSHDIESKNQSEQRYIGVKDVSENWATYTAQKLSSDEINFLNKYPDKFYLYIIHFELEKDKRNEEGIEEAPYDIYVIPGNKLESEFNVSMFMPVSKKGLEEYKISPR